MKFIQNIAGQHVGVPADQLIKTVLPEDAFFTVNKNLKMQ